MSMAIKMRRLVQMLGLAAVVAASAPVCANDAAVLIKGEGKQVTTADIRADALRIPENVRPEVLAKPTTVQDIATNLYVRRVMAERGRAEGLDKQADIAAAVQIAVDKIISDAYLVQFNREHAPSEKLIEAQAKADYQAKKESYDIPEKLHAAHILIAGNGPKTEEKAKKVLAQLKTGADFAEVAKKESDDPGSAQRGGDLGFFERGRMVPAFEQAAFDMKPGEVSGLVKSQFGYHIIKSIEKQAAKPQKYDDVKDQIKKKVAEDLLAKERAAVVKKVTEAMVVEQPAIEAFSKQYEKK